MLDSPVEVPDKVSYGSMKYVQEGSLVRLEWSLDCAYHNRGIVILGLANKTDTERCFTRLDILMDTPILYGRGKAYVKVSKMDWGYHIGGRVIMALPKYGYTESVFYAMGC